MIVPGASRERRIWLRVGTLVNGVSNAPLRDAHVVYSSEQILYADEEAPPRHVVGEGRGEPDAELPEHTLLPGLIDAHTHLFLEGGELDADKRAAYLQQSPAHLLESARARLAQLVRLGVASVRDAGDKDGVGIALSRLAANMDRPLMPFVDSPGAAIHHRGRYGSFMAEPIEDHASPRACVEARVRSGSDRIKLIATGIINFRAGAVTTEPQMTADEIRALVEAAASFGRQTFAHASGDAGIERVIEGQVDSVEHGYFVRPDQLAQMRDRGIAWTPTFAPVAKQIEHAERVGWDARTVANLKRIIDGHATSLRRAHELGVTILAGSDAGSYGVAHGFGLFDELEAMERAGLRPPDVVRAATGAASERLRFREKFGQIRAGFLPRFLLTRFSPLETVAHLRRERTVVFDGEVFETDERRDASGL